MSNMSANDRAHYEQVGSKSRETVYFLSGTFRTNDYVIYVMRLRSKKKKKKNAKKNRPL